MQEIVIVDVNWLCGTVLGTLLSPQHFERTQIRPDENGVVLKEDVYKVRRLDVRLLAFIS